MKHVYLTAALVEVFCFGALLGGLRVFNLFLFRCTCHLFSYLFSVSYIADNVKVQDLKIYVIDKNINSNEVTFSQKSVN